MPKIRILAQSCRDVSENPDLIARAQEARKAPGCLQFEYFRGYEHPENVALLELWESQEAFDAFWLSWVEQGYADSGGPKTEMMRELGEDGTEIYHFWGYYGLVDGVWTPTDPALQSKTIWWPGRGPVRIIIQSSPEGLDSRIPAMIENSAETRREPGCIQFEHFRSIEFPEASVLLELWEDSEIYDLHWHLRLRTGSGGRGGPRPATIPRRHGENGPEWYHQQQFYKLYNLWVPVDRHQWSETVAWPD